MKISESFYEKVENIYGRFDYQVLANGWQIKIDERWIAENIKQVFIPQLRGKPTYGGFISGNIQFHVKAHESLRCAFDEVEQAGLVDDIIFWGGSFNTRFVRGSSTRISCHSWGIAFDINPAENPLGKVPAPVGTKGSVLRIVPILERHGFFWGGHFNRCDAMHFQRTTT